jgi:hypothetical protein
MEYIILTSRVEGKKKPVTRRVIQGDKKKQIVTEVNCIRKGPLGNVISIVKCARMWEESADTCVGNGCKIGSVVKHTAHKLVAFTKEADANKRNTHNRHGTPRRKRNPLPATFAGV